MRLLHTSTFKLHEFYGKHIPKYAILSHRWEDEEVTFQDLQASSDTWLHQWSHQWSRILGKRSRGWSKIEGCCRRAVQDNLEYVWIDTCCIDKSSSAELSEAINSMYRWYKQSTVCYAYLCDVSSKGADTLERTFAESKWFTRGWTLQELLAPGDIVFFDGDWAEIGTRDYFASQIETVTGIRPHDLQHRSVQSIAKRMSWASKRETLREEDMAYCLLGLFDINMPLLYGEGDKAFMRLQHEIVRQSDDESIFAWQQHDENVSELRCSGLLASSPADFTHTHSIIARRSDRKDNSPYSMTNKGLHLVLDMHEITPPIRSKGAPDSPKFWSAQFNCGRQERDSRIVNRSLLRIVLLEVHGEYQRVGPQLWESEGWADDAVDPELSDQDPPLLQRSRDVYVQQQHRMRDEIDYYLLKDVKGETMDSWMKCGGRTSCKRMIGS